MRTALRIILAIAFPLLSLAAVTTGVPSANASTAALALYAANTNECLVAASSGFYMSGGCSETPSSLNHAALWYYPTQGYDPNYGVNEVWLENVHYLNCVTVYETGGPYAATCGSNHVQWWEIISYDGSSTNFVLRNVHTGYYLCAVPGGGLVQWTDAANGDCQWNVRYTSV